MNARDDLIYRISRHISTESAERMVDAHRTEVLTKAVGRLRAIPVDCTALTGPIWYGDGWNSAITCLEDIADYQGPDDEAYPGELQRLRATVLALRVAALRKGDLPEVQRVLVAHAEWEKATASAAPATPDFFQVGRTYAREHHGRRIEFHVRYIDTAPDCDFPTAFGWRKDPEMPCVLPMDSDDTGGWTDITDTTGDSK